jgi:signal transduction histidine kinase
MKRLSIRFKITFWFTMALILVVLLTYFITFSVSNRIIQKTIRDSLIATVENNVDEIEFYQSIEEMDLSGDVDHFLEYENGYLEVDDDFLDAVNDVYTSLYRADGTFLYGENPIAGETEGYAFTDSKVQQTTIDGTIYYLFDRKLTAEGLEGLWLRGVVSEEQGAAQMSDIVRLSLILMPALVIAASIGGYLIARRMLRPIQKISDTARQIGGENDLKKRIELGTGNDELHQLADSFNDMFEKLERAFEAERQFTSDASHELRTPVSVITAQCELSLEETRSTEEYEEALRVIQRQSRKMSRLINDMLDFTRLEVGPDRYQKENMDITKMVESICADMALIQEKGITLQYDTEDDIVFYGNRELLTRLLTNLISNAYRYGKEDGHIWVRLQKADGEISLIVQDDGIGIAKEEQQKIFQRFYQADSSRAGAGMGLGLSMAQEIARFHGGRIAVESAPDVGSTFKVSFKKETESFLL